MRFTTYAGRAGQLTVSVGVATALGKSLLIKFWTRCAHLPDAGDSRNSQCAGAFVPMTCSFEQDVCPMPCPAIVLGTSPWPALQMASDRSTARSNLSEAGGRCAMSRLVTKSVVVTHLL